MFVSYPPIYFYMISIYKNITHIMMNLGLVVHEPIIFFIKLMLQLLQVAFEIHEEKHVNKVLFPSAV